MLSPLLLTLITAVLTLLPSTTHSQSVPFPAPIVAHFSFDTNFNSQFNGYTASPPSQSAGPPIIGLADPQTGAACPFNGCASFTGNRYLDVNQWLPFTPQTDNVPLSSWGVALWVKANGGGYQALLGEWGGGSYVFSLRLVNYQPQLIWRFRDTNQVESQVFFTSATSHTLSSTSWSHLAVTFNASSFQVQVWIDGLETDTTYDYSAVTSYIQGGPAPLGWKIGLIDDVMFGMQGSIDELWIFSTVLTPSDILLLRAINSIGSCSPGSAGIAQYNIGSCTPCLPGYYSGNLGALVCSICPAGTSSAAGAESCQACAAGTNSSAPGGQCQSCPAGYYAPTPGMASCLPCPAGTFAAAGASTCSYCPANSISPAAATSSASCTACPANTSGGGPVPVCCPKGVSAAGQLLATTTVALSNFGVSNQCILSTDVLQAGAVVEYLSEFCGDGYDSVLTSSLTSVYSDFSAFQSKAGTVALQQVYCNQ